MIFNPPFARLKARLYYAAIGFRYDGYHGMRAYWRRFK